MGLSRNKVAVSEGAAGSPPFYGEPADFHGSVRNGVQRTYEEKYRTFVVQFSGIRGRSLERGKAEGPGKDGGVAQLGEHLPCKQGVMGSIPIISTIFQDEPQSGSA